MLKKAKKVLASIMAVAMVASPLASVTVSASDNAADDRKIVSEISSEEKSQQIVTDGVQEEIILESIQEEDLKEDATVKQENDISSTEGAELSDIETKDTKDNAGKDDVKKEQETVKEEKAEEKDKADSKASDEKKEEKADDKKTGIVQNGTIPSYILANLDPSYITASETTKGFGLVANMAYKQTYVDASVAGTSIDAYFANITNEDYSDGFLITTNTAIDLYDVNAESEYVVGYLNEKGENIADIIFAKRNDNGQVLSREHYDYSTGLVYIYKMDLMTIDDASKTIIPNDVQAQVLIPSDAGILEESIDNGAIDYMTGYDSAGAELASLWPEEYPVPSSVIPEIIGSLYVGASIEFTAAKTYNGLSNQTLNYLYTTGTATSESFYTYVLNGNGAGAGEVWNGAASTTRYAGYTYGLTPFYAGYSVPVTSGNISNINGDPTLKKWMEKAASAGALTLDCDCTHISVPYGSGYDNVPFKMTCVEVGSNYAIISYIAMKSTNGEQSLTGTYIIGYVPNVKGKLQLVKASTCPQVSTGNDLYSLAGAVYGVYKDPQCAAGSWVGNLQTDATGATGWMEVDPGTYYVKELTAPKGFKLNSEIKSVTVGDSAIVQLAVSDEPFNDPLNILLVKQDAETGKLQGNARLEGAHYTVKYYDVVSDEIPVQDPAERGLTPKLTWLFQTDANGIIRMNDSYRIGGNALVLAADGSPTIPLGTITVEETKAPQGYELSGETHAFRIRENAIQTVIEGNIPDESDPHLEDIIRADLEFTKVDDAGRAMGNIPFEITSLTTQESHIIVSDTNGLVSTDAVPHSQNTNRGRTAADGIWFGAGEVDKSR